MPVLKYHGSRIYKTCTTKITDCVTTFMENLILAVVVIALFAGSFAHAEDNKPDTTLTFNGCAETYCIRGLFST